MLKEALSYLFDRGAESNRVQLLTHEALPKSLLIRTEDGIEEREIPPPRRDAKFHDLESLLLMCGSQAHPEVYIGPESIIAFTDGADRREQVGLPILPTAAWASLVELAGGCSFDVRGLVKFLRFKVAAPGHVLDAVRRIDFSRKTAATHGVGHGREQLGKAVEAEVIQAEKVPESFTVDVEPFRTQGCRDVARVEVSVYLDMANERIELHVSPDEMVQARDAVLATIAARVRAALPSTPVYRGAP